MATRTLFCDPPSEALERAPALARDRALQDGLLSILFVAAIALPGLLYTSDFDISRLAAASRERPGSLPAARTWASYGSGIRQDFQEHFGLREALIRTHALLTAKGLGVSPSPTVLWGKQGWLFYADDGAADDIVARTPFTDDELLVWQKALTHNHDWLAARGITYVFMLAPDKHVIYPEYLPSSPRKLGERSRLEQLQATLRSQTDLALVDLTAALREAKGGDRVFDRTDTHWNARGAYAAYRAILDVMGARVPGVGATWRPSDFVPTRTIAPGQDLAEMLRLEDVWPEEVLGLEPRRARRARVTEPAHARPSGNEGYLVTEISGSHLPRAVIFRDSFTSRLIPFLSEHWSRAVYLWQADVDLDVIEKERPDVVIHEIVGRHLTTLVPYDPVAAREKADPRSARPTQLGPRAATGHTAR